MLLAGGEDVEEFFHEVEWSTIFFFHRTVYHGRWSGGDGSDQLSGREVSGSDKGECGTITSESIIWVSGFLSAFLDNIPYVATMIPLVERLGQDIGASRNRSCLVVPGHWSLSREVTVP